MRYRKASWLSKPHLFWMLVLVALLPCGAWPGVHDGMGDDGSDMSSCYTENSDGPADDDCHADAMASEHATRATYTPEGRMIYFAATGSAVRNVVTVQWETRSEPRISGFFVWRSQQRDDSYIRIHNIMILSKGGDNRGGFYTFDDYDVVSGRTYYYKIQEIEESGFDRFYGPVASDGSIDWDETRDKSRIHISCFIHTLF